MIKELDLNSEVYNDIALDFYVASEEIDVKQMAEDLTDTLLNMNRPYLCANEIGIGLRAAAVKFGDEVKLFYNPVAQSKSDLKLNREVSDNGREYIIPRYNLMVISYLDESSKEITCRLEGDAAVVFSQILDCMNGVHPEDFGLEVIPEFDEATDEERREVLNNYLSELSKLNDKLDEELKNDKDLSKWWTNFKYNKAVVEGQVEFEKIDGKANRKQRRLLERISRKIGGKKKK